MPANTLWFLPTGGTDSHAQWLWQFQKSIHSKKIEEKYSLSTGEAIFWSFYCSIMRVPRMEIVSKNTFFCFFKRTLIKYAWLWHSRCSKPLMYNRSVHKLNNSRPFWTANWLDECDPYAKVIEPTLASYLTNWNERWRSSSPIEKMKRKQEQLITLCEA